MRPLPEQVVHLPFGPGPYRMAMDLVTAPESAWFEFDKRYPAEMAEKRRLLATMPADVFAVTPESDDARARGAGIDRGGADDASSGLVQSGRLGGAAQSPDRGDLGHPLLRSAGSGRATGAGRSVPDPEWCGRSHVYGRFALLSQSLAVARQNRQASGCRARAGAAVCRYGSRVRSTGSCGI